MSIPPTNSRFTETQDSYHAFLNHSRVCISSNANRLSSGLLLFILFSAMATMGFAQGNTVGPEKYIKGRNRDSAGHEITRIIVPERPPALRRSPEVEYSANAVVIDLVPAYKWSFGCSPTAAAMAAGFYDKTDFPDVYTGASNGGQMPQNNNIWGTITINGEILDQCPLSATREGLDGRTTRGNVDDYWHSTGSYSSDPYLVNGWTAHTPGDCTADFMGTSQSENNVTDGGTLFYYYTNGDPLYDFTLLEPGSRDGCHGMRLFYESRGYSVVENYSQFIQDYNGNTGGFGFEQYKEEIDNSRPVLIQVAGHTMVGYGYDEEGRIVYLHDTWDNGIHAMAWGGSYEGLQHYGVTVLRLQSETGPPVSDFSAAPATVNPGETVNFTDLSSGSPIAWEWSFEGGIPASSTEQNPVVTYYEPGKFSVRLVSTNEYGYDSEFRSDFISVLPCLSTNHCEDYITGVQMTGLDTINNSCGSDGYSDYTGLTTNVVPGRTYSISVLTDSITLPGERTGIWFDWNLDNEFTGSNEFIELTAVPDTNLFNGSFTPPINSFTNLPIRMRVRMTHAGELTPCGEGGLGETEDYTVMLLQPEIIITPDTLDFGDIVQFHCSDPLPYTVSGNNLSSPIFITASADMQVSFFPDHGFTYALSIPPTNDSVAETAIYVKFCIWWTTGEYEYISNSSPGAVTRQVILHASMVIPPQGDAPASTIAHVSALHDTLVYVPVTVSGFNDVQYGGLSIFYNPGIVTFQGITHEHSEIGWWYLDWYEVQVSDTLTRIQIYLDGHDNPRSIPDNENLMDLMFSYAHGASPLAFAEGYGSWNDSWWRDMNDEPFSDFYIPGSVTPQMKSVHLKIFLESLTDSNQTGMRKASGAMGYQFGGSIADTLSIRLANSVEPYVCTTTSGSIPLLNDGSCRFMLPLAFEGDYYLVVVHRNGIETWSALPVTFNEDYIVYDFSDAASKAYGNNLKLIGNKYCIYSGDINLDGTIDSADMTLLDNDVGNFSSGYLSSDLNGDGIIDTGDTTILDNNANSFVSSVQP